MLTHADGSILTESELNRLRTINHVLKEYGVLLKEARDLLVMCSLFDKSGQCMELVDKIDKKITIAP